MSEDTPREGAEQGRPLQHPAFERGVSRRSFLRWGAAVGGGAAALGAGLRGNASNPLPAFAEASAGKRSGASLPDGVTIVPSGCAHNCGGHCVLKAWVKDGRIIRITTDDRPDSAADPQLRACPRGRAYRRRVYHPDRLKYPMKRVGERGEAKFARVSWDEAAQLVADAMRRVRDKHGPTAFFNLYATGGSSLFAGSQMSARLLNLFGGRLGYYNSYSSACARWIRATPPTSCARAGAAIGPTIWRSAPTISRTAPAPSTSAPT